MINGGNQKMVDGGNPFLGKRKKTENDIEEALSRLVEKVKHLQKERLELIREIEELGEQAEHEAKKLESEVSTLKKQATTLNEVLRDIRTHKKQP